MTRRFWIGLLLTLPVFVLEMGGHLGHLHMLSSQQLRNWLQLALATPVVLWAGWPFFVRGWASVKARSLNMFTLIAMGTGVAWIYSVVATLLPGLFPAAFRGSDGAVAVYFEAAAVITVLVLLGQVLELKAREQTGGAIRALLELAPKTARRLGADGREEDVALDDVVVGDRLRVRPGEKVPVDGDILDGRSRRRVDGDGRGHARGQRPSGDTVIGGTINQTRQLRHARREGRARDHAGARSSHMVAAGAAQPRAHSAAGRPGLGLVRAAGDRRRRAGLRCLVALGAGAALDLCA